MPSNLSFSFFFVREFSLKAKDMFFFFHLFFFLSFCIPRVSASTSQRNGWMARVTQRGSPGVMVCHVTWQAGARSLAGRGRNLAAGEGWRLARVHHSLPCSPPLFLLFSPPLFRRFHAFLLSFFGFSSFRCRSEAFSYFLLFVFVYPNFSLPLWSPSFFPPVVIRIFSTSFFSPLLSPLFYSFLCYPFFLFDTARHFSPFAHP